MSSSKCYAALVVNGNCSLLPPTPDHGLIAEPKRELVAFSPTLGAGSGPLGEEVCFPKDSCLTPPPTSHFVSDGLVSGGLFRTMLAFW